MALSPHALMTLGVEFIKDPVKAIAGWGGRIGPARHLESLYMIRAVMNDDHSEDQPMVVFGYPFFVAERLTPP